MTQLKLSICIDIHQDYSVLQKLIEELRQRGSSSLDVEINPISWEDSRNQLIAMTINHQAGGVSQIGTPLVSDLIAMNALRPFSPYELDEIGGEAAFAPAAWKSAQRVSDGRIYSLPWLADPRVVFYWRDMFEKAGVDEKIAFQTPENLTEALSRLQASGVLKPWVLAAGNKLGAIHTVCSWIWAAGGEFVSEDGKKALFMEPEGLAGLKAYFSMVRFMGSESYTTDYRVNDRLFTTRQSPIIQGMVETAMTIIKNTPAEMHSKFGVALLFGVPLIGGSSLVVWDNSRNQQATVNLVHFLTGKAVQSAYPASIGLLPVRLDVLNEPPYSTDPILQVFSDALRRGRVFPITKLSGLLEEHLGNALVEIWTTLAADPDADLDTLIVSNLAPIVRRYNNWAE